MTIRELIAGRLVPVRVDRPGVARGVFGILLASLLVGTSLVAQERAATEAPPAPPGSETLRIEDLRQHLEYLASDKLQGRAAGTRGNDQAAAYIAKIFKDLGLERAVQGGRSWYQSFEAESEYYKTVPTKNVIGFLPGTDDSLAEEFVIVGAHFDHVGIGKFGSREVRVSGVKDEIHNGADDNASGTAGLLELAQAFATAPTRRGILFLAFSAEELGLLGSKHYCTDPVRPLEQCIAMFNFDMIGRSEDDYLFVGGTGTSPIWPDLLRDHVSSAGLDLELGPGGRAPSDSTAFYEAGLPVLFFHTNLHLDYHRVSDEAEFINFGSELQILRAAYSLIRSVADAETRPAFTTADADAAPGNMDEMARLPSRALDLARMARGRARARIDKQGCGRLGFIPGAGVRGELLVSELLAEGPAAIAGLEAGDVILRVADQAVELSSEVAEALKDVDAEAEIELVYRRRGESVAVQITVGK